MSPSKKYPHLISGTQRCYLSHLEKSLYRCDYDLVKDLEMRITQVGPTCHHTCPQERLRGKSDSDRREGNVTTEGEMRLMPPQAKERRQPPDAGRGKEQTALSDP